MAEGGDLRVVLLGKTGAGKSSLGNTLLGDDAFMVTAGMSSGTVDNQVVGAERFGTYLQVVDTPGLCDSHRDKAEVLEEVGSSITAVHPGPHIILLVLRCDARFTKEEHAAYTTLKTLFGEGICHHMIVVFNGIDHLHNTPVQQRLALDEEVRNFSGSLRHVLEDASFRYYGVNNKASWSSRDQSASALLHMMETLSAKNQGAYFGCHTPDLCDLGPNSEDGSQEEEEEEEEREEEEEEEDADDAVDVGSKKYTCGIM